MHKAWIFEGKIRDIAWTDPNEIYHPSVAIFYDTDVPDDAKPGMVLIDGNWGFEIPQVNNPDPEVPK
jgi:hypothetical protein